MQSETKNGFLSQVIKGVAVSIVAVAICTLAFALLLRSVYLSGTVVKAVNQFIKTIAIFVGCFYSIRDNRGLFKGVCVGVISSIVAYLSFAAISKNVFNFGSFFAEMIFGGIIGGICGVITLSFKGKDA